MTEYDPRLTQLALKLLETENVDVADLEKLIAIEDLQKHPDVSVAGYKQPDDIHDVFEAYIILRKPCKTYDELETKLNSLGIATDEEKLQLMENNAGYFVDSGANGNIIIDVYGGIEVKPFGYEVKLIEDSEDVPF